MEQFMWDLGTAICMLLLLLVILQLYAMYIVVIIYTLLSGSLKWRYATGSYVWSSPAIGSDGTIYVGSYDGYLYAITSTGNIF